MKKTVFTLSVMIFLMSNIPLYAAEKVVVVPLGGSVKTTNKTLYYNLPPSAFTPSLFTNDIPRGNFISGQFFSLIAPVKTIGLAAPLQLPDGAEITNFSCYVQDNDSVENISGNSPAYLWRRPILLPDKELITTEFNMETTGGSTDIQSFSSPSIDYPLIDNSLYAYGAYTLYKITGNPTSFTNLRFYGCRVTYKLDVVQP